MNINEARSLVGNRPIWELKVMVKALNLLPLLNTAEDNQRLEAAQLILKKELTSDLS
jgi:hypothetical protein